MGGATRGELVHVCLERLHRDLADKYGDEALSSGSLKRAAKMIPTAEEEVKALGWSFGENSVELPGE